MACTTNRHLLVLHPLVVTSPLLSKLPVKTLSACPRPAVYPLVLHNHRLASLALHCTMMAPHAYATRMHHQITHSLGLPTNPMLTHLFMHSIMVGLLPPMFDIRLLEHIVT